MRVGRVRPEPSRRRYPLGRARRRPRRRRDDDGTPAEPDVRVRRGRALEADTGAAAELLRGERRRRLRLDGLERVPAALVAVRSRMDRPGVGGVIGAGRRREGQRGQREGAGRMAGGGAGSAIGGGLVHHGAQIASGYPRIVQGSHRGGPRRARGRVRCAPSRWFAPQRASRGALGLAGGGQRRRRRRRAVARRTFLGSRRDRVVDVAGAGMVQRRGSARGVDCVRRRADGHDDGRGCAQNDGGVR